MQTWEMIADGRVQGVGFRWHAWNCASKHSILGYVRNQPDGTVLVIAQAEEDALQLFAAELKLCFGRAVVKSLEITNFNTTKRYNDFEIR